MQVDAVAASQKEARCGRSFGRIVHRWRATTEQVEIQRQVTMVATVAKFWVMSRVIRRRGQAAEDDSQEGDSQEGRQRRWFGRIVHRWVATSAQVTMQRSLTTVGTVAKFWERTTKPRVSRQNKEEGQEKRRRHRLHQEGRQRNRWKKVGKAAVQGEQQTERARALVLARERSRVQRAEQGQLLLEAADRGVEGVRLRRALARALYSWGLGHAQDRARCMQVQVQGDTMVQCRTSLVMGSAIGQWHMNRVCDRA